MIDKQDVSSKILSGRRLTKEEFEVAKKEKYVNNIPFKFWDSTFYEDDKHIGYLCIKGGKIQSNKPKKGYMCAWGIHREDVQKQYLRPEQKKYW